jgi:hypothetical protein
MWPPMMTTFDNNNAINTAHTLNAAAIVSYNQSSDDYTIISYDESTNDSTIIKTALDDDAVNDTIIDVMDVWGLAHNAMVPYHFPILFLRCNNCTITSFLHFNPYGAIIAP